MLKLLTPIAASLFTLAAHAHGSSYYVQEDFYARAAREREAALNTWDNAIRDEATDRRKRLERAAVRHRMSNKHGVRIDHYTLKGGRTISCTTTIKGNSAAIFDCDGDVN